MRHILTAIFLFLATSVAAQEEEIQGVIQSQMEAFAERDVAEAWSYASPMIKGLFGNSGNFGAMVQQGYPMVWNNDEVRFDELREINGALWQKVIIRDTDGVFHALDYKMIETPEGWQIDGVQLLEAPDLAV